MTRLVWRNTNQKKYEQGVDRGVLYPSNGPGVVWNGLVTVEESFSGGERSPQYFDGVKYVDFITPRSFQAKITAFSAPSAFAPCIGEKSIVPGMILTRQSRQRFGFSYRSLIEDDKGYKIHLVYNALASPEGRGYSSLNETSSVDPFSWSIDAVPPKVDGFRPSAHFVFDSTQVDTSSLDTIESILYGTLKAEPRMPTFDEIFDIMLELGSLVVVPDTAAGLAQLVPGTGDLYKTRVEGFHRALPDTRLTETIVNGLYGLE